MSCAWRALQRRSQRRTNRTLLPLVRARAVVSLGLNPGASQRTIPGVMAAMKQEAIRVPAAARAVPALIASAAAGAGAVVVAAVMVRASGTVKIATERSASVPRRRAMKQTWSQVSQPVPRRVPQAVLPWVLRPTLRRT